VTDLISHLDPDTDVPAVPAESVDVGASFQDNPALKGFWYAVARSADLEPGGVMEARVLATDIAVWRTRDGRLGATDNKCPHREAPLSMGEVGGDGCLTCPYHGWRFETDGTCVEIPSQRPELPITSRASVKGFHAKDRYGLVWVCLGEPVQDIVDIPEVEDPAYRVINTAGSVFKCSAGRVAENFLDATHFSFLHRPTFGSATEPLMPPLTLISDEHRVGYRYDFDAANPDYARVTTLQDGDVLRRHMTMSIHLPFVTLNMVEYDTGLRHIIFNATTPIDDDNTLVFMTLIRNDDHSVDPDVAITLDKAIVEEDKVMLERIPGPLPLDPRKLVHAGADRAAVEWMRRLRALLESGLSGGAV